MTRGKQHYFDKIVDDAPVDVYTATNSAMMEYPYVLGRIGECSPSLAAQADSYIMDSGIGDETTTEGVYEIAAKRNSNYVVPCDVIGDTAETTDATMEMLEFAADSDITTVIPLQSDSRYNYLQHYDEQVSMLSDYGYSTDRPFFIGGIRDMSVPDQIATTMEIREYVGDDVYLHGLGCGINKDWAITIRQHPMLLDSIDTSAVFQFARSGKAFDQEVTPMKFKCPRGANSTALQVMLREWMLYLYSYLIGPHARKSDVPSEPTNERVEALLGL